ALDGAQTIAEEGTGGGVASLPEVPGYDVSAEIGRGGMGVVYRARQRGTGRLVALKMLRTDPGDGGEALTRFRPEIRAAGTLEHPNIVRVYEVGEQDGRPYFSMEYVDGGTLAERLGGAPLAARPAAALVEKLSRAVQHAHQHGIVHRDLKPANILLASGGRQPP